MIPLASLAQALQLLQIAASVAKSIKVDMAEFQASLDANGELPEAKRKEYLARAQAAVDRL